MRISGHKLNPPCARQTQANHAFLLTKYTAAHGSGSKLSVHCPFLNCCDFPTSPVPRRPVRLFVTAMVLQNLPLSTCFCSVINRTLYYPRSMVSVPRKKKSTKGRSILNISGYCWHATVNTPHTLSNVRNGALGPFSVKYHDYAHPQISYFTLQHHK